jgi:hypothetical protein
MEVMRDSLQPPGLAAARNDLRHGLRRQRQPSPSEAGTCEAFHAASAHYLGWSPSVLGAIAYLRDAPAAQVHIIDSTHFAPNGAS